MTEDYPTYQELEDVKSKYWKYYSEAETPYQKAGYLLNGIIWAHYWRARKEIENSKRSRTFLKRIVGKQYFPGYTLEIDHYTRHWLAANGDRHDKDVIDSMEKDHYYKEEKSIYLPKGMSCYQI